MAARPRIAELLGHKASDIVEVDGEQVIRIEANEFRPLKTK